MKAVVCEGFGGPEVLHLREVAEPPPPGPGEVQVRIQARGVQYVDVLMIAGKYQFRPQLPFVPGIDAAGEVVALGDGVGGFRLGDRVMSRHRIGAFAELGNAAADDCNLLPPALGFEAAAGFRSAYHTAYYALVQRGRLKAGDWVLIHGAAGGIGNAAIDIAKLFGATVVATAGSDEKRAACLADGADYAIDYRAGFRDRVKELSGARDGVDIVYDPIGGPVFDESLRCLAWGGRILVLGFVSGAPALARTNYLLIKGIDVLGVRVSGLPEYEPETGHANMRMLVDLAGQGRLRPRIWRCLPLEGAGEAIRAIIERRVIGKAVLVG
jgi:NADPH2:quinone reductase